MSQQAGDCFAIMQGDGNFCVYHGTGPGANIGGALWCAMSQHGGPCFAAIQDDGNFCVYPGNPGAAVGPALWCAMRTDPVADVEIVSIDYDVQNARTLHSGAQELYRQTLTNNTGQAQNTSINGSTSIAETSGWTDSKSYRIGASVGFKAGIPIVGEGQVTVSADVTTTFTHNASTQNTRTWGFTAPVNVPPHTTIVALVSVSNSTIIVPYRLKGTVILSSGARLPGRTIKGVYTGSNSHDLTVTFVQPDPQLLTSVGEFTRISSTLSA